MTDEAERTVRLNMTPDESLTLARALRDAVDAAHERATASNLVADYDTVNAVQSMLCRLIDARNRDHAYRAEADRLFAKEA